MTLRSTKSFFGSLIYYSRVDSAIYDSVLYELREADFCEINRSSGDKPERQMTEGDHLKGKTTRGNHVQDLVRSNIDADRGMNFESEQDAEKRNRCEKASIAFTLIKAKISTIMIFKHFDSDGQAVVVAYAST